MYKKIGSFLVLTMCLASFLGISASAISQDNMEVSQSSPVVQEQLSKLDFEHINLEQYNDVLEASKLAYMNINSVRSAMQVGKILEARKTIIYSQTWKEDGCVSYIETASGEIKEIADFHELFPEDWEYPVEDNEKVTGQRDMLVSAVNDDEDADKFGFWIYNPSQTSITQDRARIFGLNYAKEYVYASKLPGSSWNAGFSLNGVNVGFAQYLSVGDKFVKDLDGGKTYGVRGSTFSTEGYAEIYTGYRYY